MRYFSLSEFACPDCGRADMDSDFLEMLDRARDISGIPFIITSGFRCPRHNEKVGGRPNSAHLRGLAADIKVADNRQRFIIVDALIKVEFKRLGIAKDFIHVDHDMTKPYPRVWLYL